jgi:hypothetical protein
MNDNIVYKHPMSLFLLEKRFFCNGIHPLYYKYTFFYQKKQVFLEKSEKSRNLAKKGHKRPVFYVPSLWQRVLFRKIALPMHKIELSSL